MKKKFLSIFLILLSVVFVFSMFSCAKKDLPAKDKIIIGAARPLSGGLAPFQNASFGPIYEMWVQEVNKAGGIYVKEYGKKLPVEMKIYDDKSDMATMTRLLEKLIVEDKVDFVFSPASTAFVFAAAEIAHKHNFLFLGAEGGGTSMEPRMKEMGNVFLGLQYSNRYQMPALAKIFQEKGVKKVAVFFIEDLHGIEYQSQAAAEFAKVGIDTVLVKGVPPDLMDVSPLLKQAKAAGAEAVCSFTYPPVTWNVVSQAKENGLNFNAILLGPGGDMAAVILGKEIVEGVMFEGAFCRQSSKAINDWIDLFLTYHKPDRMGWWGHVNYYAMLQCFQQAIEKAGTLDHQKIIKVLNTEKFDTILGKTWFVDGLFAEECHPGQIGQWRDGNPQVIDVGAKRTAEPVYPKPDWK